MLTIRLSRIGKKKKPMYRLIISEKAKDPYGRALEILGSYNPYTKELQAKSDRIKYWLSQGSGMSSTVNNLLVEKGIIKGEKVKASKARKKKKDKDKQPTVEKEVVKDQKTEEKSDSKPAAETEKPKDKKIEPEEKSQENSNE